LQLELVTQRDDRRRCWTLAGVKLALPKTLVFASPPARFTVEGGPGKGKGLGPELQFGPSIRKWTFIPQLWTVVLG
jgi:hypothetical protein